MAKTATEPTVKVSKIVTPFTLLAKAFEEKWTTECLELVHSVYMYLTHRKPPVSLRWKWAEEMRVCCKDPKMTGCDFDIKTLKRNGKPIGMYYISVRSFTSGAVEAYVDYSNTALAVGIDGRRDKIAKRARQLMG
ncbi:MAG: hypothetical protein Q7R94_00150 [bacterium]|nr:hypothetical protein [bacterium]